jgi:hypothetical protein
MSMRKYSDYNSYLAHVKNCKIINTTISDLTRIYDAKLNTCCGQNDYLTQTQNLYISTEPNYNVASLQCKNSLIVMPIDAKYNSQYSSIFSLPCDSTTINGLEKKITNTCSVGENQRIFMYSNNNNQGVIGRGGFNSGGAYFKYYIFSGIGDNLSSIWSENENTWIVQSYGGVFTNNLV